MMMVEIQKVNSLITSVINLECDKTRGTHHMRPIGLRLCLGDPQPAHTQSPTT